MSNIISVKDLDLWYGNTQALKKININIEEKTIRVCYKNIID